MTSRKTCPGCKTTNELSKDYCTNCSYPFQATEQEQSKFIGQLILKKSTIAEAKTKIKRARIALWVIGAYFIGSTLILFFAWDYLSITYYLPGIFFGLLFVGFGFLTYRMPAISIIIPLVLLVAYWIFSASLGANNLLIGLFFKIAILMVLGYALLSVFQAKRLSEESNFLNSQ